MPDFDINQVLKDSLDFAKKELGSTYKKVKPFAEHEFRQFSENTLFLAQLKLRGVIDDQEFKSRMQMQKLSMANVLLAIKGVGIVAAQNLVNGVADIVGKAIKKALNIVVPL
jgi:hypothetical protein